MRTRIRPACVKRSNPDADLKSWARQFVARTDTNPRHQFIVADLLRELEATR